MKVFVGGSKALKALPKAMREKLGELCEQGADYLVGDCLGADALAQQFLTENGCTTVEIYAVEGKPRHNAGGWPVHCVDVPTRISRIWMLGDENYLIKDKAMACNADCGLFAWNGRSRGTLVDILLLVALGKPATVVRLGCLGAITIGSFDDIRSMLGKRNPQHVCARGFIPPQEQARCLDLFMPSVSMTSCLSLFPMTKADAISMILGSPASLDRKLEFFESASYMDDVFHEAVDQIYELLKRDDFGDSSFKTLSVERALDYVAASSFSTHRNNIRKALALLRHFGPHELIYRKSVWDEQPDLFEEHEVGIAPFHTFEQALDDLRFEMVEEEWDEDVKCWTVFEKWYCRADRIWRNPYVFYAIGDEVVFFDKKHYTDEKGRWFSKNRTYSGDFTGNLNLRVPFRAGDIVTLDCRPFAPLTHGLVLEPEPKNRIDCCYPRVLAKMDESGLWYDTSLKHNAGLYMCMPGYSALYKAEVYDGSLPFDEEILREVSDWMDGETRKGKLLAQALFCGMTSEAIRSFIAGTRSSEIVMLAADSD